MSEYYFVKPKLDVIFKMIFGAKKNEDMLRHMLARLLEKDPDSIRNIEVKNPEVPPSFPEGKFSRLDLSLEMDGSLVNIEIQLSRYKKYADRALFYWSKLYSDDMKSGEFYASAKPCIQVNILDFSMFDCAECHSRFSVMERNRQEVLTEKFDMHFFELTKLPGQIDEHNFMELWLRLINAQSEEDLEMLDNTNVNEIKKATEYVRSLTNDENAREQARMREKQILDEKSFVAEARLEGRLEGREQGRLEGREQGRLEGREQGELAMIESLRAIGVSEELINKATMHKKLNSSADTRS